MRRRGGDLRIAPGSIKSFLSDGRSVVEMDQVVRHARMPWLALRNLLQDGRAFELVGVRLVGRRSRGVEGERIIDLRFVIVWIALCQLFHGLGVSLHARAVID